VGALQVCPICLDFLPPSDEHGQDATTTAPGKEGNSKNKKRGDDNDDTDDSDGDGEGDGGDSDGEDTDDGDENDLARWMGSSQSTPASQEERVVHLSCGHSFCSPCMSSLVASQLDIDGSTIASGSSSSSSSSSAGNSGGSGSGVSGSGVGEQRERTVRQLATRRSVGILCPVCRSCKREKHAAISASN